MQMARLRRDTGDGLQALRRFIGASICTDVCGQSLDLLLGVDQLIGQQLQGLARWRGQIGPVTCCNQALDIVNSLRDDDAELAEMRPRHAGGVLSARHAGGVLSARRIHDLGLLAHQKLPRVAPKAHLWCDVGHQQGLRVLTIHWNKSHGRARNGFTNCRGISRIGLATLHIPLHVAGLHQSHLMVELSQLPGPVMRAGAGRSALSQVMIRRSTL